MNRRSAAPLVLEVAAAILVPAACYGFVRVFIESAAITPVIGAAVLSTFVAILLRRIRVPLAPAALLSLVFLAVLIINRFAPGTARLGLIPTGATIEQFQLLIDELVLKFKELKTPVEALDPFVATAMVAAWIMAFLTDWGALRLRLAFEPVLPAALLFIFSAVLGAGTHQILATVIFATAVAFWAVAQRSVNLADGNAWLANDRRRGSLGVAQAATVFAVMALIAGIVVGPRLPGAAAEEMLSFRDTGDPTRVVVSPFVNIEARLVEQSATQLFTVTSAQPSYWRLAGLDEYDDQIWKVAGNFSPEDGRLPGRQTEGGQREDIQQDFSIAALDEIWLPAAFAPAEIVDTTASLTWNAESGSLTVANDITSSDGVDYSLISSIPRFTVDELRAAPETVPLEIADRYTPLPNVPDIVREQAQAVTASGVTRYDKMLALQEWFRNDFTYSTNLSPTEGRDPLEHFLEDRVGFCQQFAGTFAVMARLLGIPARVAIGFTWGDPIGQADDGRTIYQVTGRQTHAWPEIWFEGLGWVAFEPTPGRGAPASVSYTNVPASQDSLIQPDNPDGPVTTTTTAPVDQSQLDDGPVIPDIPIETGAASGSDADSGGGLSLGAFLRILAVLAVLGAYFAGVPAYQQYKRQRRRQRIDSPSTGVETAWAEATETLELGFGLQRRPSETRREYANRLASDMRVPRDAMGQLADKVTVARYHPTGLSEADATTATELAGQIEESVNSRVPFFTRWKRQIDPRRLVKSGDRIAITSPLPSGADPSKNGQSSNGSKPRQPVG